MPSKRPCESIGLEHIRPCDECDIVAASLRSLARWARKEAREAWETAGIATANQVADEALRRAKKLDGRKK